jgi:hypothetical protein
MPFIKNIVESMESSSAVPFFAQLLFSPQRVAVAHLKLIETNCTVIKDAKRAPSGRFRRLFVAEGWPHRRRRGRQSTVG